MKRINVKSGFLTLLLFVVCLSAREYTIIPYDNLWNLSKGFYQDGFEWKRIWHANSYIVNPDLIFPGDVLIIPGVGEVTVKSDGTYQVRGITFDDRVASLFTSGTVVTESSVGAPLVVDMVDKTIEDYLISASAMLTVPYTHAEVSSAGFIEPGIASIDDDNRSSYTQYSVVKVKTDNGLDLPAGRYTIVEPVKFKELDDNLINIVRPVAFAEVQGKDSVFISKSWDLVGDSARLVPAEELSVEGGKILRNDAAPLEVKLFSRVDDDVLINMYEMMIVNGGANIGVQVGDLYDVYELIGKEEKRKKLGAEVMVVKVQAKTATVIVTKTEEIIKDVDLLFKRSARLSVSSLD